MLARDAVQSLGKTLWCSGLHVPVPERRADPPNVGEFPAATLAPGEVVSHLLPPFGRQGLVSERGEVLSEAFTAGIGNSFHL